MEVLLEEYGEMALDVLGAVTAIISCVSMFIPGGMLNQFIEKLLQMSC